jgi:hypothetical protein
MLADIERESKLGSDIVRTRDQNGITEPCGLEVECASESTNVAVGSKSRVALTTGLMASRALPLSKETPAEA